MKLLFFTVLVCTTILAGELVDNVNLKGKVFYGFFVVQILIGLIAALFPKVNLFGLTLYADFLNGAMLPVIFYFLIKFSENSEIMGTYVSKGFSKFFLRASTAVIFVAVVVSFIGKFL
jgi:Mn2+/Fe2+ NRAMP family transporter